MDLLADSGYYIVDNLPVPLLGSFLELSKSTGTRFANTALLLDVDSGDSRRQLLAFLDATPLDSKQVQVVFLDADNSTIVRRYSETRRPHPGFNANEDRTLEDTIERERARLQPIKERANFVLDTSSFNTHALKRELREFLLSLGMDAGRTVRVNFLSFGFKHGIPLDCDLVVDVRFLRNNPQYVEHLREKDGLNQDVRDYVFAHSETGEFIDRYSDLLTFLLPKYKFEGKAYVNIGVGCTGGKHRSVAVAEELSKRVDASTFQVSVKHRDNTR
jgi:UPF0042 nucleotide-binding protein